MRVMSAVGARPQLIKAAPVSAALRREGIDEILVHSGQHYDYEMSEVFFHDLEIPEPHVNLGVGSGTHGRQTGEMLIRFEKVMLEHQPDWVIVHGDTNSTIAAALAAVKLGLRVAHNEAGLRSFNRAMPEEHNRVLTDHCADLLFCPTETAYRQLAREGILRGVHRVGDVMYDAALRFAAIAEKKSRILARLGVEPGGYVLATLHRPYNVDSPARLCAIFRGFARCELPIVLPRHPRLRERMQADDLAAPAPVQVIDPVGYLDMLMLEKHAQMILTDSGGVQKEAYFFGVPCLTLRPETEWVETVAAGWNRLADADEDEIAAAFSGEWWPQSRERLFGDGRAAESIVRILAEQSSAE